MIQIGGDSGNVSGVTVLEPVVFSLITPVFLSEITWSGRSAKGQPNKIPLKRYGRVVSVITSMCNKADKHYSLDLCLKHLKSKVLKYAYKLAEPKSTTASTSTNSNSNTLSSHSPAMSEIIS